MLCCISERKISGYDSFYLKTNGTIVMHCTFNTSVLVLHDFGVATSWSRKQNKSWKQREMVAHKVFVVSYDIFCNGRSFLLLRSYQNQHHWDWLLINNQLPQTYKSFVFFFNWYLQIPHSSQWYCFLESWNNNQSWISLIHIPVYKKRVWRKLTSSSKNLHFEQKYFPIHTPQLEQFCWTCKKTNHRSASRHIFTQITFDLFQKKKQILTSCSVSHSEQITWHKKKQNQKFITVKK